MTTNNEHFMKLADDAAAKAFEMISQIANLRLECLANEFRLQFPKQSLKITFGDKAERIAINGKSYWWFMLDFPKIEYACIVNTIIDVLKITKHYTRGRPDDLEVLPDDSELQGGPDERSYITTVQKSVGSDIRHDEEFPGYRCPRPGLPGDSIHI